MALWTKKKLTRIFPAKLEKVPLFVLLILQFNIHWFLLPWNLCCDHWPTSSSIWFCYFMYISYHCQIGKTLAKYSSAWSSSNRFYLSAVYRRGSGTAGAVWCKVKGKQLRFRGLLPLNLRYNNENNEYSMDLTYLNCSCLTSPKDPCGSVAVITFQQRDLICEQKLNSFQRKG